MIVQSECQAISERGGVLGAMDTMYRRGKIQEESLYLYDVGGEYRRNM